MKKYTYYLEMEYLCQRAEVALRSLKNNMLANVYYYASKGYHQQSEQLSAAKAEETVGSTLYENLKKLNKWVEHKEVEAAKTRS